MKQEFKLHIIILTFTLIIPLTILAKPSDFVRISVAGDWTGGHIVGKLGLWVFELFHQIYDTPPRYV